MSHVFWHSGHHRQSRSTSGPRPRSAEWVAHRSASTPGIEKWHRRYTNHTLSPLILSPLVPHQGCHQNYPTRIRSEFAAKHSLVEHITFSSLSSCCCGGNPFCIWGTQTHSPHHRVTRALSVYWSCFVDMLHIIINSDYCVHKCSSSNRIADRSNRLRYFEEAVVVVQTVIVVVDTFI